MLSSRAELDQAIAAWRELILADPRAAAEQQEQLLAWQREGNVLFGGRAMALSLRPALLPEGTYRQVARAAAAVRQALDELTPHILHEVALQDELGLTEEERELAAILTPLQQLSATTRLDAFFTPGSFRFVEVNAESPAGLAYCHHLAEIYRRLEIFQRFAARFPLRYVSPLRHLLHGLLRAYFEEHDGRQEHPTFAIVDFLDIPTYPEFLLVKAYLESHGYPCEVCDPRQLELDGEGYVVANGRRVDILYRRLLVNELLPIRAEAQAFLAGYRAGRTLYINSLRAKLLHKKAVFDLLTRADITGRLPAHLQEALATHVPWTRRLRDTVTTTPDGQGELLAWVRRNRSRLVLKPNDEYGGKGVVLGFAVSEREWDEALAVGADGSYVVQELVDIRREPFLQWDGSTWQEVECVVDLDPYLNGPLVGGCLTRVSSTHLANVTAGGGTLPLFILRSP